MSKKQGALVALVIACALLVATYAGRLEGDYVWDDAFLVADNPSLTSAGGLRRILTTDLWSAAGEPRSQLYHPLPMMTLWAQAQLGALSVVSGRIVNLALHATCALLLALVLLRLAVPWAASLALPFVLLVHPSAVEPVMWLTGRHDLLGVAFVLGALVVWPRHEHARPWLRASLAALLCASAFLCKEPYVVAPALLVALCWTERERRVWLVVPSLIAVALVFVLRHALGISSSSTAMANGPLVLARSYASIVWHYAAQLLSLSSGPTIESWAVLGAPATVLVLAVVATVLALSWRTRVVAFGFGWFFLALAPHVLSLPLIGLYANRYAYFPLCGLLVAAAGVVQRLASASRGVRLAEFALGGLIVLGAMRSRAEAATWHDNLSLYTASVEARPDDGRALYHLGQAVQRQRGCAAALPLLIEAAKRAPDYARSWRNLAGCLIDVGRPADAVGPARRAVALSPDEASQHYNLGAALVLSGQHDEGKTELETALRLDPRHERARALLEHL